MASEKQPTTEAPTEAAKPAITFAQKGRSRSKSYELEWPLDIGGVELTHIEVRRLTGEEVADLQERLSQGGGTNEALIAEFADQPVEVINALDQDDIEELGDMVYDFLPRRMREGMEALAAQEQSSIGATSSAKSPTPSNGASETS